MKPILGAEAQVVCAELARAQALLAFDFDGTLAPLVSDRDQAAMRPQTRRLLRRLARAYPCVVISGRSRADVSRRLRGVPLRDVVGNHGAESGPTRDDGALEALVRRWHASLRSELARVAGVDIEDKRLSLAVHYRTRRPQAAARELIMRAASRLRGARVFPGHAVVNITHADAPHKGDALGRLLRRAGRRPVLYVGDDHTDEDVFRAEFLDVGVRVGRSSRSSAPWFLPHQAAIDALLDVLLESRERATSSSIREGRRVHPGRRDLQQR